MTYQARINASAAAIFDAAAITGETVEDATERFLAQEPQCESDRGAIVSVLKRQPSRPAFGPFVPINIAGARGPVPRTEDSQEG